MARKLIVELIADPRGYTAGLQTAAKQTKVFGAEMDKATRGILSGSGAVSHFGRSLAFASGGLVAFAGATQFLEDSISAARDAGVAQRSLGAQMKASGESFTASKDAIDKAGLSMAKFGFTSTEGEQALAVLDRATGNVGRSVQLQGVAANIARARNISLSQAALILGKAYDGQTTSLKRLGVQLPQGAKGMQAIYIAAQKFSGQAKAGTTVSERFAATLHDTEVIIGTALLPTLNRFLESLGKWLQKMNESGRLQKDVNEVVKTATGIFQGVMAVVKPLVTVFQDFGKAVGGTKNEVELLVGAFVAFKAAELIGRLTNIATAITTIGTEAEASTGKVSLLRTALLGGGGPGTIVALAGAAGLYMQQGAQNAAEQAQIAAAASFKPGDKLETTLVPRIAKQIGEMLAKGMTSSQVLTTLRQQLGGSLKADDLIAEAFQFRAGANPKLAQRVAAATATALGGVAVPTGVHGAGIVNKALTAAQNRAIGLAGDPQNLGLLRQQAQADQAALAFAKKLRAQNRITNAQYVKEVTGYASDLQQTKSTIAGILQTARQKTVDAAKAAADKQKQAAQAAAQKLQDAQQALLGRLQFNVDKTQLTKGLTDDLAALRAQQAGIRKIIATQGATQALLGDLLNVELAINAKKQEIASARSDQKAAAADKAAKRVQAKLDAANLVVAKAGLTDTLTDDLSANKKLLAVMKKTGASAIDIVNQQIAINDLKKQLADQVAAGKKADDNAATAADQASQSSRRLFKHLNATAFVNQFGAGLTRDQRRRLEVGLAMTGPGGTLPAGHSGQFMAGITIHGGVHMHGVHDVAGLENQIAKRAKARPFVRRGVRG